MSDSNAEVHDAEGQGKRKGWSADTADPIVKSLSMTLAHRGLVFVMGTWATHTLQKRGAVVQIAMADTAHRVTCRQALVSAMGT